MFIFWNQGLGPGFPLPVEITPFCHEHTLRLVQGLPSVKGTLNTKYIVLIMNSLLESSWVEMNTCKPHKIEVICTVMFCIFG